MTSRRIAILLAAASLGLFPGSAFAQGADAPVPDAQAAPAPVSKPAKQGARSRKPHAVHAAKPSANKPSAKAAKAAKAAAAPAAGAAAIGGGEGESEAASLERRRRAFFATKPDAAAPEPEAPSAGVTLGGSGGISPGMGFKF